MNAVTLLFLVVGAALTALLYVFAIRRLLGLRLPFLRTLIAGVIAFLVACRHHPADTEHPAGPLVCHPRHDAPRCRRGVCPIRLDARPSLSRPWTAQAPG